MNRRNHMKKIIIASIIMMMSILGWVGLKMNKETQQIHLEINQEEVVFTAGENCLEKEFNMLDGQKITITNKGNTTVYVERQKLYPGATIELCNVELDFENNIQVKVKFPGDFEYTTYTIKTLPSDFPMYETTGQSLYNGDYYFTINVGAKRSYLTKVNANGKIIFYKKIHNRTYRFKKEQGQQGIRYTYLEAQEWQTANSDVACDFVAMDENYHEIDRAQYKLEDGTYNGIDFHDTLYLEDKHYIFATYQEEVVDNMPEALGYGNTMKVETCFIEEVQDNEIIWQFKSTDYPELYTHYEETGILIPQVTEEYYGNYMHVNSFAIDPIDGNLVCSFRNLDEIIKLDRTTGKILWILGGKGDQFGLTEEQKFSKQHYVSFVEKNTILLYDNGAKNMASRIVKIQINETSKTVESYKSYDLGVFTKSSGSVQLVEESMYLLCYGMKEDEKKQNIEEKNMDTDEVYFSFSINYYSPILIEEARKIQ